MKKLLIRAEDKNIWERRAPLIPDDVCSIIKDSGAEIFIEKSKKRFFTESAYVKAGAELVDDMESGDVIFGVKEIPVEKLLDNKIYGFFSHTIKKQKENMPMLKRIISGNSTLIDYEKITDSNNKRQVYFGNFAGDAGAINILWLMGQYWRYKKIRTPFEACRQALEYFSVEEAKSHLSEIGQKISKDGLPQSIQPLVIAILGYGNVSKGAQSILDCLPIIRIEPSELPVLFQQENSSSNHIYLTVFREMDLVESKTGAPFNLEEYYNYPHKFQSVFQKYLPYISIIINAIFWDQRYPKFVTWDALQNLYKVYAEPKLQGIADITCDINGSIECNVRTTDSGEPAYLVNPITKKISEGHQGEGIVTMTVDNLPAELPNDASVFFSSQLVKYTSNILKADYTTRLRESGLHPDVQKAVIVYRGELTADYKYLQDHL